VLSASLRRSILIVLMVLVTFRRNDLSPMSDTQKLAHVTQQAESADLDLTDRRIGDFHLLRRLGRGGMGDVYLAEQESLKRQVAFKILRPSMAGDTNYVQRFTQEARAAAKLVHANIVQIYEVGCKEGIHYISQEYVPGSNLRQLMARQKRPLDAPLAMVIMRQVAAALQKAAEAGIVHRDIKPENIMLTPNGEVKVADFGLARITGDGEALHLTQLGMTMGSPLYMSPEQAEGKAVDPRSDLYSFGATCFHMLVGRPPFEGVSPLSVAVQHVKTPPPNLAELRPDLPTGLCELVQRMLAKQPEQRFASANEIIRALRMLAGETMHDNLLGTLEGWNDVAAPAVLHTRFAATQKLDQIVKTQAIASATPATKKISWWQMTAIVLVAFFCGGLLASLSKPKPLLPTVKEVRQPK